MWLSPALPGRTHDLTAARTPKILRICARQGVPILADMAYIGAGDWVTTAKRRPPNGELTLTERTESPFLPVGEYGPYPENLRAHFEGVVWRFRNGAK